MVKDKVIKLKNQPLDGWKRELIAKYKPDGEVLIPCRSHNIALILKNDHEFKGRITFDELAQQILLDEKPLNDVGPIKIKTFLEKNYIQEKVSTGNIIDAVTLIASENSFHPIKQYLLSLSWDKTNRLEAMFSRYFGAKQSKYSEYAGKSFMTSAVARIFQPGCQVDTMIVLEGEQGCGKSTSLSTLFSSQWHSEITANVNDKDFFQCMRGKWLMEFGEMSGIKKADYTHIKQVITVRNDNYRPSYAAFSRDFPRQNIFAGTTNEQTYLIDPTGARRFLPIACGKIDIGAIKEDRDQLWAEALQLFYAKHDWSKIPGAKDEQDARYQSDSWEEKIVQWLDTRTELMTSEILEDCFKIDASKHSKTDQIRVGQIMAKLGWKKARILKNGSRIWHYIKS